MRRNRLAFGLSVLLMVTVVAPAGAANESDVVGTWRGTAEEVASPHIQGRAQVTLEVMPDGRWTSVWRQAGRERRSSGHWWLTPNLVVLETDSREPVAPRLSLLHRSDVAYGTALAPLPEGRSATVALALRHVAPAAVASRPQL